MRAMVIDDNKTQAALIEQILNMLDKSIQVIKHVNPLEALIDILDKKPDILFIDKKFPGENVDGIQLKKYIDATENYDPYCILFSGALEYKEIFDYHFDKPISVSKIEKALLSYKNRDRDFLREFLEENFCNQNDVDFLYKLIKISEVEKPDKQKKLFQRMEDLFDYKARTVKRRLFRVIENNKNLFDDNAKCTPDIFIKRLRASAALYHAEHSEV